MIDDRRGVLAADGAEIADGEGATAEILERSLTVANFSGQGLNALGNLRNGKRVDAAKDGTTRPRSIFDGDAKIDVFLINDLARFHVDRSVERGMLLQGQSARL